MSRKYTRLLPLAELLAAQAVFLEIMELIVQAVLIQPLPGLFDGVAVADAI